MTLRERLARAEHYRAAWLYCDPSVRLTSAQSARRDALDAEIAALAKQLGIRFARYEREEVK